MDRRPPAAGTFRGKWFLMNSDGSSKTSLTSDNDPHFQVSTCNDDKHIVYWNVHNGQIELWSAAADGANAQKLAPATLIGSGICGPDSKSVLYVKDGAVWSIPIEGGTPEKTNFPFAQIGFSPDGQFFYQISQKVEGGSLHAKLIVSPTSGGSPDRVFDVPYGMSRRNSLLTAKRSRFCLHVTGRLISGNNHWIRKIWFKSQSSPAARCSGLPGRRMESNWRLPAVCGRLML
jgi:hypothetical protein